MIEMYKTYTTRRQKYEIIRQQLENERATFLSHWRDIGDHVFPRRPRFTVTDGNRGERKNQKIIDNTSTLSARTLRSGMMSGITSPARPWFRLSVPDFALGEMASVKFWLSAVTDRMSAMFLKSNLYNVLPVIYGDLGAFGTAAMLIDPDPEDIIRCLPVPIGSYTIANDDKLRVRVFYRDFRMTVRQLVQMFGEVSKSGVINWEKNFSEHVKNLYLNGHLESWIDVRHCIMPNDDYDPRRLESKYKKYISVYYEAGSQGYDSGNYLTLDYDKYLREKGYDYFPVLCPRWEVTGEDVYGTECPGMTALGDIKQLQLGEKRAFQAIEKMINPPMVAPTSLKQQKASILPSDITYVDIREGQQGFRPAHEINFRIQELEAKQEQCRQRIRRAFYEDLFLMLANTTRRQITAREIEERHEEKLLALGPVLEQLNQDLLDPLIDIGFQRMLEEGQIPEAPEEIRGANLKVEYISIMAQAQKLVGISSVERFTQFVGGLAGLNPSVLDKLDADQLVDVYGDITSVPPSVIKTDEDVAVIRGQRAQAAAQQRQAEMMMQGTSAVKNLSQSSLEGDNALSRLAEVANAGRLT